MKPAIGRIVHVSIMGKRVPAIVTRLLDEDQIEVYTLDGSEFLLKVTYAEEMAPSAAKPNNMDTPMYTWAWPPRVP